MQGHVTLYLYGSQLPRYDLTPISCMNGNCKRIIFKADANKLVATNSGVPYETLPSSVKYQEIMCHSCKTLYRVLFQ
jgi:hypothetical protein